jgi:hypothetical protein
MPENELQGSHIYVRLHTLKRQQEPKFTQMIAWACCRSHQQPACILSFKVPWQVFGYGPKHGERGGEQSSATWSKLTASLADM